jgi:DNA-binding CsgD family transcriptional regulator
MEVLITPREKEIFKLIANGLNAKQVAEHLVISYHTVTTHRKNVINKLGVSGTVAAMSQMLRNGLLE